MRYLVRVDDYPYGLQRNTEVNPDKYANFHAVFEELEIPYCLGVVPAITTFKQIKYLKTLKDVVIGQHGFDHSERFLHQHEAIIRHQLFQGREILKDFSPEIYIPPFNELGNMRMFSILEQCGFKIVTGGPGSERVLPDIFSIRKIGNILYIPTHEFCYGKSWDILKTYEKITGDLVGITLHWTWEVNFLYQEHLRELLTAIKPFVIDWRNMDTKYISVEKYPMKISSRIPFKLIVEKIQPHSLVLDMGSKDSALPALIARKGCDVTALDLSEEDLRKGINQHGINLNVLYRIVTADFFDYMPDTLFDIITGCYSFGENPKYLGKDYSRNTDDIKTQFEKANQLLKIGGKLLIAVPFTKEEKAWVNEKRGDPMYIFNVDAVVNLIADSGFKINVLQYYTYDEQQGTTSLTNRENAIAMFIEAEKI